MENNSSGTSSPGGEDVSLPGYLPGVDIENGLQMCNDNRSLYLEMLKKFRDTKRNDREDVRALLEIGNREAACRIAHNMKSTAAVLGAAELSSAARQLEETIVQSVEELLEVRLEKFGQSLKKVISGMDTAFGAAKEASGAHMVHGVLPDTSAEAGRSVGSVTILLAEDDRMLMEVTAETLESHGYTVFRAYDGDEAVKLFSNNQNLIDLVILDAIMPKLTGKQAWDMIVSVRPDIKGCFVSAYVEEIMGGKLAVDYSLPFISKPVMPAVLLNTVQKILEGTSRI